MLILFTNANKWKLIIDTTTGRWTGALRCQFQKVTAESDVIGNLIWETRSGNIGEFNTKIINYFYYISEKTVSKVLREYIDRGGCQPLHKGIQFEYLSMLFVQIFELNKLIFHLQFS